MVAVPRGFGGRRVRSLKALPWPPQEQALGLPAGAEECNPSTWAARSALKAVSEICAERDQLAEGPWTLASEAAAGKDDRDRIFVRVGWKEGCLWTVEGLEGFPQRGNVVAMVRRGDEVRYRGTEEPPDEPRRHCLNGRGGC